MPDRDMTSLNRVALAARELDEKRARLIAESEVWLAKQLQKDITELEQAVMAALDEHKLAAVARAFTVSGKTPNRNAIYAIRAKYNNVAQSMELPFEWVERTVETAAGTRTVFDVHADMFAYGPRAWSGEYTWRYDNGRLEPVITEIDPYPIEDPFYKKALDRWLTVSPYPGSE